MSDSWYSTIIRLQRERWARFEDPTISMMDAPRLALQLTEGLGRTSISPELLELLERSVSFGTNRGLSAGEIEELAFKWSLQCGNDTKFAYGMVVLVSLGVARVLDANQKAQGGSGISENFAVESQMVEDLLLQGKLDVFADPDMPASMTGHYFIKDNAFGFPDVEKMLQIEAMFETVIHEARHAVQDINAIPIPAFDSEREATVAGKRAYFLIDRGNPFVKDPDGFLLEENVKNFNRYTRYLESGCSLFGSKSEPPICYGLRAEDDKKIAAREKLETGIWMTMYLGLYDFSAADFLDVYKLFYLPYHDVDITIAYDGVF